MAHETLVHVALRVFPSGARLPAMVVSAADLRSSVPQQDAGLPLTSLALLLALYELVEAGPAGGMRLADICKHWRIRGHGDGELRGALRDAMRAGGFRLMAKAADSRVIPEALERTLLNPRTLGELQQLIGAYAELREHGAGMRGSSVQPVTVVAAPVAPESRGVASAGPGGARRILVVDDDVDTATSCAMALGLEGHQTRIAFDGPTALVAARSFHPEIVVLDLGLPGMNGFEVAKNLRRNPATCAAQIVAVTGYCDSKYRRRARDAGFNHHLLKPAGLDQLNRVIAAYRSAA